MTSGKTVAAGCRSQLLPAHESKQVCGLDQEETPWQSMKSGKNTLKFTIYKTPNSLSCGKLVGIPDGTVGL